MKRLLLVLLLTASACAPKSLSPMAQVAYTADQIVIRLGEVQAAVIAACNAGTGPTCAANAPLTTDTSRALVMAIVSSVTTLKATPDGGLATVRVGWQQAKLQPVLMTAGALGYVLAVDIALGVS